MSGGSGTRLWPMSRVAKPKQFLPLVTDETLFQETAKRFRCENYAAPLVICGEAHVSLVKSQLAAINMAPAAIITEPMPRNTAAVAAAASVWTQQNNPGALVLLMPADHHIADPIGFRAAIANGATAAKKDAIVTFGIHPTEPHTGFGYIESAEPLSPSVFRVNAFKEKPDQETAKAYIRSGNYHWNAGIFLFDATVMRAELDRYAPDIAKFAALALTTATPTADAIMLEPEAFSQCPSDSIDYAVMERTDTAVVVAPVDVGWNDIGAWTALASAPDDPQTTMIDCADTIVKTAGPAVAAIGVEDLIIIATDDAILVTKKSRAQDVKSVIADLKMKNRQDLL